MPENGRRGVAWGRIVYAIFSVLSAAILTYLFHDRMHNTTETITVIAAIFSILAGVLIAVISILGDPAMLMDQSWRYNYLHSREIQRKLHRKIDIFILYIAVLASLFGFALVEDRQSSLYEVMQAVVFFLVLLGFLASISLPFSLIKIQRERLDRAIDGMKGRTKE